jgi:hypothetical protein
MQLMMNIIPNVKKKKLLSIYSCVQKYDLKQLFSCKKWQEAEL